MTDPVNSGWTNTQRVTNFLTSPTNPESYRLTNLITKVVKYIVSIALYPLAFVADITCKLFGLNKPKTGGSTGSPEAKVEENTETKVEENTETKVEENKAPSSLKNKAANRLSSIASGIYSGYKYVTKHPGKALVIALTIFGGLGGYHFRNTAAALHNSYFCPTSSNNTNTTSSWPTNTSSNNTNTTSSWPTNSAGVFNLSDTTKDNCDKGKTLIKDHITNCKKNG